MQTVKITRNQFEELKRLRRRRRWDWPAVFSVNCLRHIWPWVTRGHTELKDRKEVRGISPIIDAVAEKYLRIRTDGGRFFIDDRGAFYKVQELEEVQFAQFVFLDDYPEATETLPALGESSARIRFRVTKEFQ